MLNEFERTPAAPLAQKQQMQNDTADAYNNPNNVNDEARLGLVKEMMQVILGLTPETMERVMRTIRGSSNAADVKTVNMRQRIGNRAMRYLRNAIDQARTEGNEQHIDAPDMDKSKVPDLEPGHQNSRRHPKVQQSGGPEMDESTTTTFKNFLVELNIDVDLEDPGAATAEIKRAARMGTDRAATQNVQNAKNDMDMAKSGDPTDPTRQIDIKIAGLNQQLAILQKRKAQMSQQQGNM